MVAIGSLLFAAPWSISRIGGAGLASALITLIAGLGASIEGHHARVVMNAEVKPLSSLVEWQPDAEDQDFVAARLPAPLHHEWDLKASLSKRVSSGKNGSRTINQTAVPLSAPDGTVVGFTCEQKRRADGPYVLSAAKWYGSEPELCEEVVGLSVRKLSEAGRAVSGPARRRIVKVYETEAALRSDHSLAMVFTMPLWFFGVFAVFAVIFRRAGADSLD
ncbi:MAG: hypothetical protein GQE15_06735 [Archangiaceae bacterium]|nr:hypothetical protein [Archangiaceae bacterium]